MSNLRLCLSVSCLFIFTASCTSVNIPKQSEEAHNTKVKIKQNEEKLEDKDKDFINSAILKKNKEFKLEKTITLLISNQNKEDIVRQFINVLEIGVYNKSFQNVNFDIQIYNNHKELEKIVLNSENGKIFIGPIEKNDTKFVKNFCNKKIIFFSFSSDPNIAGECIYLVNFFPKNEIEQLFLSLNKEAKVALLYSENAYGYMINSLIDDAINNTEIVLVNRASYKNNLSNVRDAIKELGKYELRKYELDRQKQILYSKNDNESKKRLKKLQKFKTTSDYDFTHILIADYGLNLLQVAPLLTYYDIDPEVVQFIGTGVIDDANFFYEPSLQGTIFPGVEKDKRQNLIDQYRDIYDQDLLRISTLPYDLLGLLNFFLSKDITINEMFKTLNSASVKFEGVDGKFYFKNNLIERDLDILQISTGKAKKIN
ncbi:hypothetical protein N9U75_01100 [Pelagibacteraceae bacterium]|nr:hypothetical protein [Pelagibacteraceae bacterium]